VKVDAKIALAALAVLAVSSLTRPARAVPPRVGGIDLPLVLAAYDRVRQVDYEETSGDLARHRPLQKIHTIVLDPGHGGLNQGAIGVAGIHEKFLTLELAYALRDRIQRAHPEVRVVMTRYWDTDVGLTERIEMANQLDADLFLSLHYNAAVHPRALGFETYFLVASEATPGKAQVRGKPVATASMKITGITNTVDDHPTQGTYHQTIVTIERDLARERQHRDSGLLARVVQQQLNRQLHSVNRGVKQANFAVLRGALMPAVVVESAFLTHPEEGRKLTHAAHRARVSTALLRAIETFDRDLTERSR